MNSGFTPVTATSLAPIWTVNHPINSSGSPTAGKIGSSATAITRPSPRSRNRRVQARSRPDQQIGGRFAEAAGQDGVQSGGTGLPAILSVILSSFPRIRFTSSTFPVRRPLAAMRSSMATCVSTRAPFPASARGICGSRSRLRPDPPRPWFPWRPVCSRGPTRR